MSEPNEPTVDAPMPRGGLLGRLGPRGRALVILAVILGLLIAGFLLLSGGGDEEPFTPTPRASGAPRPTATATTTPAPPPQTGEAFESKDPFQPLVQANTGGGGGTPGPEPTPTSGGNPTDGNETRRVSLDDVFSEDGERFATVSVDDEQFTVSEGDTFADNFRVIDLTKNCGTFVFGDERFTLCLGQEVRK